MSKRHGPSRLIIGLAAALTIAAPATACEQEGPTAEESATTRLEALIAESVESVNSGESNLSSHTGPYPHPPQVIFFGDKRATGTQLRDVKLEDIASINRYTGNRATQEFGAAFGDTVVWQIILKENGR